MLARREHSQAELRRQLLQKNFDAKEIEMVLCDLQKEGLQDDRRFVENFIYYQKNRGAGPLRIRAALLERGIHQDLIEQHLNIDDNDWLDQIRKVWQKRFKNTQPDNLKTRMQQKRFLYYRGFTHEQIEHLLQKCEQP